MSQARDFIVLSLCFSIISAPVQAESVLDNLRSYVGGSVAGWGDLETKRIALETQITDSQKAGKLTAAQAADFRAQLKVIADAEAQAKIANRRMSFRENVQFTRDIYTISSQIDQAISTQVISLPDVDALQAQLQAKIANALSAGHLTAQDAATLKA